MREELSDLFFQEIDGLLGYSDLLHRTHEFFGNSVIYLAEEADLSVTNNQLDFSPVCWNNNLGGFEGQRQKTWTILTICLIEISTLQNQISSSLVGQGDNQVLSLRIKIPIYRNMETNLLEPNFNLGRRKLNKFRIDFLKLCKDAGLPVKFSETWESSHVFAYGKQLFYNGMPLSMSLKRFCRQFALANDFPSIVNEISTIYGAGMSATQSDIDRSLSYSQFSLIIGIMF